MIVSGDIVVRGDEVCVVLAVVMAHTQTSCGSHETHIDINFGLKYDDWPPDPVFCVLTEDGLGWELTPWEEGYAYVSVTWH